MKTHRFEWHEAIRLLFKRLRFDKDFHIFKVLFFIHLWTFCLRIQCSTFLWMMKVNSKKRWIWTSSHFRMSRIGSVDVYLHSFSVLDLLEGEWSTLSSGFFIPRKRPRYPLNRRLNGSHFRSGRYWRGNNHLTGIRNQNRQSVASYDIGHVMAAPMNMQEEVYGNC